MLLDTLQLAALAPLAGSMRGVSSSRSQELRERLLVALCTLRATLGSTGGGCTLTRLRALSGPPGCACCKASGLSQPAWRTRRDTRSIESLYSVATHFPGCGVRGVQSLQVPQQVSRVSSSSWLMGHAEDAWLHDVESINTHRFIHCASSLHGHDYLVRCHWKC